MNNKQKKIAGLILLPITLVLMYFCVVDFDWKIYAYEYLFLIAYGFSGLGCIILLLEATGNMPDFTINEEE